MFNLSLRVGAEQLLDCSECAQLIKHTTTVRQVHRSPSRCDDDLCILPSPVPTDAGLLRVCTADHPNYDGWKGALLVVQ